MGVRSSTRAILKLSNCTFTYPGRTSPSLYNVSCALSLSRYVANLSWFHLLTISQPSRCCRPQRRWKIYTYQASNCEILCFLGLVLSKEDSKIGRNCSSRRCRLQAPCPPCWLCLSACYTPYRWVARMFIESRLPIFCVERHLEKTPIAYIQWRFQDGHDREHWPTICHHLMLKCILGELLEKVTRVLTPEEKAILEQDWVGKDGSKRKLEVREFSCVKFDKC